MREDSLGVHVEEVGGDLHHRGLQLAHNQVDSTHLGVRHDHLHVPFSMFLIYWHHYMSQLRTSQMNLCVKRIHLELVGALERLCVHLNSEPAVYLTSSEQNRSMYQMLAPAVHTCSKVIRLS